MLKRQSSNCFPKKQRLAREIRTAFTLIEMLISVTLVLLMMVLFAEVFQIAGGSIGRMRGLAENDQRSRTLQTIIKADLDKRSYRWVFPFAANENTGAAGADMGNRLGYFYISENNPNNDLDDVLQFTVMSTITIRNSDPNPYYGQALNLALLTNYPNQPDLDDGQFVSNNTGSSTVAEIVYFVRNGNLYRRQLLIREPSPVSGSNPQPTDATFSTASSNNVFNPTANPVPAFQYAASGPFWNDFDYSAYLTSSAGPTYLGATFPGSNSLDNSGSGLGAIANPALRFGFSPILQIAGWISGRPKEFAFEPPTSATAANNLSFFLGRFTLLECSDTRFIYPQNLSNYGNIPVGTSTSWTLDSDNTVNEFNGGVRRGEDLLLSNVHAFDIQVWDERAQSFVNMCDPNLVAGSADFAFGNRYASSNGTLPVPYGPRISENVASGAVNAVFDTWHPLIDFDSSNDPSPSPSTTTGQNIYDDPPFRPLSFRAKKVTGVSTDVDSWAPATRYAVGDIVFPSGPPGTFFASPPYAANTPTKLPYGQPFFYRCVQAGLSASSTNNPIPPAAPMPPNPAGPTDYILEPAWPPVDGLTVIDNGTTYGVIWQAVDNRKPLKAIKLQIRFLDTSSQQMRQLTIIHSLVD